MRTVQKKLAFVMFIAGLLVTIVNAVDDLATKTIIETLKEPSVYLVIAISSLVFITGFLDHILVKITQVALLSLTGAIALLDTYDSIYGVGLLLLATLLAYKYKFYKKNTIVKVILQLALTFFLILTSARLQSSDGSWMVGANAVIYIVMFLAITYMIFSDELQLYIHKSEKSLDRLKNEKLKLKKRLKEIEGDLEELLAPIDLEKYKLSERELEVLEALCVFRETEKQLAKRFNVVQGTIKQHLSRIRNKLGVDRREEVIELCRNNFK